MQPQLKHLGLTQLEKALPTLFETARLEQWTYELFLARAIAARLVCRPSKPWKPLIFRFNPASANGCCGNWPISPLCRPPRTLCFWDRRAPGKRT